MTDERLRILSRDDLPAILAIEKASSPEEPWRLEDFLAETERQFSFFMGIFAASPFSPATQAGPSCAPAQPVAGPGSGEAVREEGLAAYSVFWLLHGETHLMKLAVTPERRREGLGRTLVRAVAAVSRAKGSERVLLEAREDNVPALALYRSEGFLVTGRRRGYYRQGRTDAILMTLTLDPPAP
ncbi:MAG: GNAT family N-acetyltransferase [Deltaproteobacteria bacterium]|jgi:ribosomal protein S18 acetylase RimI-like enzyme|nr:GNAT family N-acetyltransferase [Deltaproteobacteria bacterium]